MKSVTLISMNKIQLVLLVLICTNLQAFGQNEQKITTFILVRHAEKGSDGTDDPDLKPEGYERARKLALMLKNTTISAVYATKYKRVRNTVSALALEKQLEVKLYEAFKTEEIEKMLSEYSGGTILISGHSNNIPWIANLLIGKEQYQTYPDSEYGNILILSVVDKGKIARATLLNY
jgi:hypothetical protein